MIKKIKQRFQSASSLFFIAAFLLLAIALISWMRPVRMDLTENGLFTLSDGTLKLLRKLNGEPIKLTLYYSDKVTQDIPSLRAYAKRVNEILQEYALQSKGAITLEVIDPEPFSEAEDKAAALGLQGIPAGNNDTIYFGVVGTRDEVSAEKEKEEKSELAIKPIVKQEVIAFFNPQKEDSLEYDISQLIYRLQQSKPLVVGIISDIPVFQYRDMKTGQVNRPKVILEQIRQMFDVRRVYDSNINRIDDEIDLLMVIHPQMWSESTLYAIDQFVLRGGKLVAFMDPKAEMDKSESMMFGSSSMDDQSSSLEQLLSAWGVEFDPKKVLLDYGFAHEIPVTQYGQALPHVGVIGIRDEGFNRNEAITAKTDQVNLASAGVLAKKEGATTSFTPLMQSSDQSELVDIEQYNRATNHKELLDLFKADGHGPRTIAAYISGAVKTAFPEGKPAVAEEKNIDEAKSTKDKEAEKNMPQVMESKESIAVVLFADTDILDDRMWVNVDDFYGQLVANPWASNSDLIVNVLEKLGGSVDLINVRSRGTYNRPFERVNELQRKANETLRHQEESLQQKLSETEEQLMKLSGDAQAFSGETASGKAPDPTPEQKAEIEKFQQERWSIRKKLRDVQHQLNKDIEQLGTVLKIINMLAVPVLLAAILLLLGWRRKKSAAASVKSLAS